MSKNVSSKLKLKLGDGKQPARTPWGLNIRANMDVELGKGAMVVRLGLECDRPLLCWLDDELSQSVSTPNKLWVALPNQELSVVLVNESENVVRLMTGQVVFKACPLDSTFDLVTE